MRSRGSVLRWCERCGRYTSSAADGWGGEICAEHDPGLDIEVEDDWDDDVDLTAIVSRQTENGV
jgi:hypothetical protein